MLAAEEGAIELRAFAAPRNGDLWSEVRPQIAADVSQHGGTATEREGRWGTELVCQMQVVLPDGNQAMQPSRIIGVNGPRWLLRATFLGQPAVEPDDAAGLGGRPRRRRRPPWRPRDAGRRRRSRSPCPTTPSAQLT